MDNNLIEEIKNHFDVVAEGLKDEIKLVAEGHVLLNEKIDRVEGNLVDEIKLVAEGHALLNEKIDRVEGNLVDKIKLVAEGHDSIRQDIHAFREEANQEFGEVKSAIKFSYTKLDRRIAFFGRQV